MCINACNNVDKLTTYIYLAYYKACIAAPLTSDNALFQSYPNIATGMHIAIVVIHDYVHIGIINI